MTCLFLKSTFCFMSYENNKVGGVILFWFSIFEEKRRTLKEQMVWNHRLNAEKLFKNDDMTLLLHIVISSKLRKAPPGWHFFVYFDPCCFKQNMRTPRFHRDVLMHFVAMACFWISVALTLGFTRLQIPTPHPTPTTQLHPGKLTFWIPKSWRFGSDEFPDFNWVIFRWTSR